MGTRGWWIALVVGLLCSCGGNNGESTDGESGSGADEARGWAGSKQENGGADAGLPSAGEESSKGGRSPIGGAPTSGGAPGGEAGSAGGSASAGGFPVSQGGAAPEAGGAEGGSPVAGGAESTGGTASGGELASEGGTDEQAGRSGSDLPGGNAGEGGTDLTPTCENIEGLEPECSAIELEANNLLIVLDKSGSMNQTPLGFGSSKWEAVKLALSQVLPSVESSLDLGLALFPFSLDGPIPEQCSALECCEVPAGEAAINVPINSGEVTAESVVAALEATSPSGGTPTAAALTRAYEYFTTGAGMNLIGPKYVLLITDGAPNCNPSANCDADHCTRNIDGNCPETQGNCCENAPEVCLDDSEVVTQISNLATAGVSTVVVGLPGTESYARYLEAFAQAGGHPTDEGSYYRIGADEGTADLERVITNVTTSLLQDCTFKLASLPANMDTVRVVINCEVLPESSSDSGWTLTPHANGPGATLAISGPACDVLQDVQRIAVYTCPSTGQ